MAGNTQPARACKLAGELSQGLIKSTAQSRYAAIVKDTGELSRVPQNLKPQK